MTKQNSKYRFFSEQSMPYIIAEIGVNHECSMEKAKDLIRLAKEGGADAVKFQSYKADKLASVNSPSYWDLGSEPTTNQNELFKKYDHFDSEHFMELAEYCKIQDIDFLSTPFDYDAVDFLDPLVNFYKVASADITYLPFLRKIAEKGKPVLLSTGASTLEEIKTAVETLYDSGCNEIGLMHCILNYPTQNENAHLGMIKGLKDEYPDLIIGYSDHTLPDGQMSVLTTAYLLGAKVIEKHFTHDKTLPGNDHYHAMDVDDLKCFVKRVDLIKDMIGPTREKRPIESERAAIQNARRSVVLAEGLQAGDTITEDKITCKRPGTGISPTHLKDVIGKKAVSDLPYDHILQWTDVK